MRKHDIPSVWAIKESLREIGFEKVSTTTHGGEVVEETYFNLAGVKIDLNYQFIEYGRV